MIHLLLVVNLFVNPELPHAPVPPEATNGKAYSSIIELNPAQIESTPATCAPGDYLACVSACVDDAMPGYRVDAVRCRYDEISQGAAKMVDCGCSYAWDGPWNPYRPVTPQVTFGLW